MATQDYNVELFQQLVRNYSPKSHAGQLVKRELVDDGLIPQSLDTLNLIDEIYYENIENGYEGPSLPEEVRDIRFYRSAMKKSLVGVAE